MKNKIIALLLIGALLCSLTACGSQNTEADTSDDTEASETENATDANATTILSVNEKHISMWRGESNEVNVVLAVPLLSDETAEEYPNLQNALQEFETTSTETGEEMLSNLYDLAESDEADLVNLGVTYFYREDLDVMRADASVLSIRRAISSDSGGAHGSEEYASLNLDTETGEELALTDVITDFDTFRTELQTRIEEKYAAYLDSFFGLDEYFEEVDADDLIWTVSSLGLTVYFNAYELGPYTLGMQTIDFWFDADASYFQENYQTVADRYVIPLAQNQPIVYDFDGDGSTEELSLNETYFYDESDTDHEYPIYAWEVSLYDGVITMEAEEERSAYLVHTNGENYFQVMGASPSSGLGGYISINLADMTEATEDDGLTEWMMPATEDEETGDEQTTIWQEASFTDPEHVILGGIGELLGTYGIQRAYTIGEKGVPTPLSEEYQATGNIVLRVKQSFNAPVVEEDLTTGDEESISEGTYLYILRTDNETYVDAICVDASEVETTDYGDGEIYYHLLSDKDAEGKIYRLTITGTEDDGHHVNGQGSEYDLFDGLLYAG